MRSLSILTGILALNLNTILGFEITIYDGVDLCSAESNTKYRIISDASDQECFNFEQPVNNWANCAQFENGGNTGPVACDSNPFIPKSIRVKNNLTGRDHPCEFYSQPDCPGSAANVAYEGCYTPTIETIRSFKCHWDQLDETPDVSIEANLACRSGMSGNVCANDCECGCTGQNMNCNAGNTSATCNDETKKNCETYCVCANP
ncbi:hypothetical protein QBC37DRAFT_400149 [Rhypophila decipiens]|uniref:Secreted protein n=1 Tax=Rhypophila decipiens TaxID=261697 RepID=A0AAN6Y822_9PEZI|nr:hypothetical protein QBC37DRAFT_400149 [Rhypophila decipiens]